MKILLVDDEENIRRALVFALRKKGHQITETNHPLSALTIFEKEPFDLLILDYNMSLLSGVDVAQIFRKSDLTTPIIILSSQKLTDTISEKLLIPECQILSKDEPLPSIVQQIENGKSTPST